MPPRFIRRQADLHALFEHLADREHEALGVAFLGRDGRLLGVRHATSHGRRSLRLPLRRIAREAVLLRASKVALAHNHPLGDPTPSRADLAATRRLATGLAALGVTLVKHLVVAPAGRTFSLRRAGLL